MTGDARTPAELRSMFGANLRRLADRYPSVSQMCRQLGINRTQFNRYLLGESFPRPDVLDRMCRFFDVDARILLMPLDTFPSQAPDAAPPDGLTQFLTPWLKGAPTAMLPDGFYHSTELPAEGTEPARHRLYHVRRQSSYALLRSFSYSAEAPDRSIHAREVRGFAVSTEAGIYALETDRAGRDSRLLVLRDRSDAAVSVWTGYSLDLACDDPRGRKLEVRFLGQDCRSALAVARMARRDPCPT